MTDKLVVILATGPQAEAVLDKEVSDQGLHVIRKESHTEYSVEEDAMVTQARYTCAKLEDIAQD
jgi:hypothetical protein